MYRQIQKLTQAERWLAEAKSLDELKQIHDIAVAAEAYAKAHQLGLQAENHAMEIRLLAARRMGELYPPPNPAEAGSKGGRGKKAAEDRQGFPEHQRLSEFRKLAEIPLPEFKQRIEAVKERGERINYNKVISDSWKGVMSTKEFDWWTPKIYIDAAKEVMGEIDLDPASCTGANKIVGAKKFYSIEDDGLSKNWEGRVFLNPPYGKAGPPFIEKLCRNINRLTEAIVLVNSNSTDTDWFQPLFEGVMCFTNHRINFISEEKKISSSTHGSCFVYFGPNDKKFAKVFSKFGNILKRWPNA